MQIHEYPNPALKERAGEVERFDADLLGLIQRMVATMRAAPGVGLAATQVGVQQRVIVFQADEEGEAVALINPVIVEASDESCESEEGCLSFPGIVIPIQRPEAVVCEGYDHEGRKVSIEADDLLARILQHEIDHLDGVLIIDRATDEERIAALRRYREAHE